MNNSFEQKLSLGRKFEMACAKWLMKKGWQVLPVYDYSGLQDGKAPVLDAIPEKKALIVPDLLVSKDGKSRWVEVKMKEHADFTRITQQYETGFSLRLWEHYQRVEEITGIPVYFIFVHIEENSVRTAPLQKLLPNNFHRKYPGKKMGPYGMVFFPFDKLLKIARTDDIIKVP